MSKYNNIFQIIKNRQRYPQIALHSEMNYSLTISWEDIDVENNLHIVYTKLFQRNLNPSSNSKKEKALSFQSYGKFFFLLLFVYSM